MASPAVKAESVSVQLSNGASASAEVFTKDSNGLVGTSMQFRQGDLVISADTTRWFLEGARGTFSGNVTAVQADLRFSCQHAEVRLSDDGGVREAVATGGVHVEQAGRTASGENATYSNGRLVLSGGPTVRHAGNVLSGKEIVFTVGKETIECKQCTMIVQGDSSP